MPIISNSKIELVPAGLSLASGRLDNAELKGTGGVNPAVGATYETISAIGGVVAQLDSAGEQIKIQSTSGDDTNSGGAAGARKVRIKGIDDTGAEVQEDLNMNGTNAVTSTTSFKAINQMFVKQLGGTNTTDANVGTITVTNNAGDATVASIVAGENRMYQAQWTKPNDKNVYITSFVYGCTKEAEISIWLKKNDTTAPNFQKMLAVVTNGGTNTYKLYNPFLLNEGGATIQFRAKKLGTDDAHVSVDFQLIQEN